METKAYGEMFPISRKELLEMTPRNEDEIRKIGIITLGKAIATAVVTAAKEGRTSFLYTDQDRLREYNKELVDYLRSLLPEVYVNILVQPVNRQTLVIDWS
jgi:hypothetical protein